VASLADGAKRAAFAPLSAVDASASKTLALRPSENTLRSILCPYWYVIDPPPMALSIDSLFELSEKTWMSLGGIVDKKSIKSFATFSFVRPCGLEILSIASEWDSCTVHRGRAIGLTDSAFGRASTRRARQVFPRLVRVILSACICRGCLRSSWAVRAAKVCEIKFSSISGGYRRASLYNAAAWVVW
jgi:hypothetical protein